MAKRRKYGEETVVMRIPKSLVPQVEEMLESAAVLESQAVEMTPAVRVVIDMMSGVFNAQMLQLMDIQEQAFLKQGDAESLEEIRAMKTCFSGAEKDRQMALAVAASFEKSAKDGKKQAFSR